MDHSAHDITEVLIVGAGPTGLMMACQLAVHQISFRIIDKNVTPPQNSGALIVQARTLEIFEQMGIADHAIKEGLVADKIDILYNGKRMADTSIKEVGRNLSQFPFLLMLEQSKTEQILLKFLESRGAFVERNRQFIHFSEDENGITTEVLMPNGSVQTVVSKYIIGADGSKSAIRNFLNIPFKGISYSRPIFIFDGEALSEFSSGVITFAFSSQTVAGFFPLKNQRWRVDGSFPGTAKDSKTISLETVAKELQGWNHLPFKMHKTEWFSVSHSQQKYAESIRVGNCFLAGDAAHVHTPVGAQGMNTGLQDAHNLAWKLAFVLKQKAKKQLLESYSTERLGISKGFARYADAIFRLVTTTNVVVRLLRTFVLKLFFKRLFPMLANNEKLRLKFFKSISQIDICYKPTFGPYKDLEKSFPHGTPKPGNRLPYIDFVLEHKKTNSHKIIKASQYTLLVLAEGFTPGIMAISEQYRLELVLLKQLPETEPIYACLGITNSGYYLIRPDMFIGLRSATLETAYLSWFLQ